jgi:serine/threonine protein kinase
LFSVSETRYASKRVTSSPQISGGLIEGSTLAGKYRIDRLLGAGGMCFVYEAEHLNLKQALALKVLKPEYAKDATAVARFAQEAQSAAGLRSPNVARVYDVDKTSDGQPFITMELLVGNDLGTELQRRYSLPMELAVDYVRQASQGIAEAHAMGIVHRDLKPENLFLSELGEMTERRLLKILDFGIAKNVTETSRKLTAPDAVFGTVDYMSPEQIRSASTVDHRTDIWSLGVILFELLTGRTPYVGDARSVIAQIVSDPIVPPSRYVPTLPPELVAVVMKALAKDPDQRYQSAQELRHALTPFMEGTESITSLLARIPPTSIPRRKPPQFGDVSGISRAPDSSREPRGTNLSFETPGISKGWTKNITVPAVGIALLFSVAVLIKIARSANKPARQPITMQAVEAPVAPPPPMPTVLLPPTTQTSYAPPPTIGLVPLTAPAPPAPVTEAATSPQASSEKPEKPEKKPKPKPHHKDPPAAQTEKPEKPPPAPAPDPKNPKLL